MRISYSYVLSLPPELDPMVSGGMTKISNEDGDLLEFLQNLSHNSQIKDGNGETVSRIWDIQFKTLDANEPSLEDELVSFNLRSR